MDYLFPVGIIIGLILIAYFLWTYVIKMYLNTSSDKNMRNFNTNMMSEQQQMDMNDRMIQMQQMNEMDRTGQMDSMNPEDFARANNDMSPKGLALASTRLCGRQTQEPIQNVMTPEPDGSIQLPGGDYKIPFNEEFGTLLPGKVGTFSPTYACDRFICDGCSSCAAAPAKDGCKMMTDDMGRNPAAMIEKMRIANNSEFPLYNLS